MLLKSFPSGVLKLVPLPPSTHIHFDVYQTENSVVYRNGVELI